MSGFGRDLEKRNLTGKLYHSCTLEGLTNLLQNFDSDRLCCSTEASSMLFGRECVLVLDVENHEGEYTPFDADAGKNYGWDEFRAYFEDTESLENAIVGIVFDTETYHDVCEFEEEELDDDRIFRIEFLEDYQKFSEEHANEEFGKETEFWNF